MSEIRFECTSCRQPVMVDTSRAGQIVQCGHCGAQLTAPAAAVQPPALPPQMPAPVRYPQANEYPKKEGMSTAAIVAIVVGCAFAGIAVLGVLAALLLPALAKARQRAREVQTRFAEGEIIKSTDGNLQVTVPYGWSKTTLLNPASLLQVANPVGEEYLMVITDSKSDYPKMTFEKYRALVGANVAKKLTGAEQSAPVELTIDGRPAFQYTISGLLKTKTTDMSVVYLQTLVEDAGHFHQLLAWTLKSRYDRNRAELEQVTASFKSRQPTKAPVAPATAVQTNVPASVPASAPEEN